MSTKQKTPNISNDGLRANKTSKIISAIIYSYQKGIHAWQNVSLSGAKLIMEIA
jgi:hypothetical protein